MTDRSTSSPDYTTETPETAAAATPARRTVLRAAGFVALAGGGAAALAACSSANTASPAPSAAPSTEAPSSSAPASPSASSSASASGSSSAAPTGPSAAAADIPVGSGTILPNADYVITQPTEGEYKAFTAICTHQQCKVTEMKSDKIYCNCHGSEFNITDGSVAQGPAKEPLKEFPTQVSGSNVYVEA